jgi:YVTN family beta-propeller protein
MRGHRAGAVLACLFSLAARADLVFVSDERGDDLRVLSTESNSEVAAIAIGKRPRGMCASPDRKTVYVALGDEDAVAVVDVASRKVVGRVPVGRDPEQVVLSPDGKVLYVSNEVA